MKHLAFLFCLCLGSQQVLAQQARFTTSGTIEFEKTVNMYALIKKGQILGKNAAGNRQQLFEEYQTGHPQFKVLKSTLVFSNNKTLFTPVDRESSTGGAFSVPMASQNNVVYCDRANNTTIMQKNIFGETFLLADSTRKIKWKITGETREVAGYTCRRANAIVMDSIYVVAFFAEKIHISGGPESFGGLPGMILELALPHENVIWRAVKVSDMAVPVNAVAPPKDGKTTDLKYLTGQIKDLVKNRVPREANLVMKINLL